VKQEKGNINMRAFVFFNKDPLCISIFSPHSLYLFFSWFGDRVMSEPNNNDVIAKEIHD
jgi:hypothetical protein